MTSATTETLRRWANPDGTFTDELAVAPIRTRSGEAWADIDTTLTTRDGALRPVATLGQVEFSSGGVGALASVALDGTGVTLGWNGSLPPPVVNGSSATYIDAKPGIDVELTALRAGFEQSFVLKTPAAVRRSVRLQLPLVAAGLSARRDRGRIALGNGKGADVAWIGAARMWDATGREAPVGVAVVDSADGRALELTPDPAFMADPTLVLPITVDPVVQVAEWRDAYINSGAATTNYGSNAYLKAGKRSSSTNQYVSYIEFPLATYAGKHILDVSQYLGAVDSVTCATKSTSLYTVTTEWYESTVTWNNRPTTDLSSAGGLATATSSGGGPQGSTCENNAWMRFNDARLTQKYQYWADNDAANFGMSVRVDSSDTQAAKDFASGENTSWTPRTHITYNNYPGTATSPAMTPSALYTRAGTSTTYVTSLTPVLTAATSDADGGTARLDVEVWDSAQTVQITSGSSSYVTAGAVASWTMPVGVLSDGASYKWRAKVHDGIDSSKSYSAWQVFTVDALAPGAPSALASAQYPEGQWNTAASGTFTWAAPATDIASYQWGLDTMTPQSSVASASVTVDPMPSGWHTFSVRAVDKAGNLGSIATYSFGAGPEITQPENGARTQSALTLESRAAAGYSYVTYKYRKSSSDDFVPIPPGHVTIASVPLAAWPLAFTSSGDSVPPGVVWALASTLGLDGSAELQVCFGTTPTTVTTCGVTLTKVTLDTNEYGDSYATAPLSPGTVSILTGNFSVDEVDADISIAGNGLSVHRTFNSKTPMTPHNGIFGDGWTSSVPTLRSGDWSTLSDHGESVVLTSSDGALTTFAQTTSGYEVTGNAERSELVLAAGAADIYGPLSFTITDPDGNVTTFEPAPALTHAAATSTPNVYQVASFDEAGSDLATTYSYAGGNIEAIVLPHAAAVSCDYSTASKTWTSLSEGCRALQFRYSSSGHVTSVTYVTTDLSGTPLHVDVACYTYTGNKLTSTWDPRLAPAGTGDYPVACGSPVLATGYGYDAVGRLSTITPPGLRPYSIAYDGSGRVSAVSRQHAAPWGTETETATVVYDVPLGPDAAHPEYRPDMRAAAVAAWGQRDVPTNATAIFTPGKTVSTSDLRDADLLYVDVTGRTVNTAAYSGSGAAGWHIGTSEYDDSGRPVRSLSPSNRAKALSPTTGAGAALGLPADTAAAAAMLDAQSLYDDLGRLRDTFGPYHLTAIDDGAGGVTTVPAREHTHFKYDDGTEVGKPFPIVFDLEVLRTTSASLSGAPVATDERDTRTTKTEYALSATDNAGWVLRSPMRTTTDPGGLALTTVTRYDEATGATIEVWSPKASDLATPAGDVDKYKTRTTYFTAPASGAADDPANCVERSWVALPCKVERVAAPGVPNLPTLPVMTFTYDYLGRAITLTERVTDSGGTAQERVTTTTYDPSPYSPRLNTTTTTGVGVEAPAVTTGYNANTGLPETTSAAATAESPASTMTTSYDDFGRETHFTDADGNVTTTTYDGASGRVSSIDDGRGTYTYGYDGNGEHRGLPTSLAVSGIAGTFTATYDAENRVAAQAFPGGLAETFARDETGRAIRVVVAREGNVWLDDSAVRSIHQQTRRSAASGSVQTYDYDAAGRLVRVQNTAGDAGCRTRVYAYDSSTNRTSSTAYPAAAPNGGCQSSTDGSPVTHTYDQADRLTAAGHDAGLVYDAFGRVVTLPANNAGGTTTTVEYYTTDLVRKQTQGTREITWSLDPALRLRTYTEKSSGVTGGIRTNHYPARNGDSPSWIDEGGGAWTRMVKGLGGTMSASLSHTGAVTYQVTNLHGDVVATGSAAATTPDDAFMADAFGNPDDTVERRYGWLGKHQRSQDALGNVVLMGVRLYAPTLGRFLQPDPVVGGSCNAYEYGCQDPVNQFDVDGRSVAGDAGGGDSPCGTVATWCVIGILKGNYNVPTGFMAWGRKKYGSRFSVIAGARGHQGRGDGGCSSPFGNTGLSFNFTFACQVHDLGYDLMRFFRSSGADGRTRQAVDWHFLGEMGYHCSNRGRWTRSRCYGWAKTYYIAVNLNSIRQGYNVP